MRGLVRKSTGSWYLVLGEDGTEYNCRIKGKFRTKGIKTTNPIAVGDWVKFEVEPGQESAVIHELEPRRNYIIRKSVNLSKQTQIIGANLDQAVLVVTLASPPTSLGFIDRFLVTAEAYDVPAILVFNKLDLFSDEGLEILQEYKKIYQDLGYVCFEVSARVGTNIELLKSLLKDKVTLVSGHSGVGKSTLINSLVPGVVLRTGDISDWSDKGKHTTTFAEMIDLPFGGQLIDTPGIRELGVVDIEKNELSHFFPEMRMRMNKCRFNNCIHINEPGCVVLEAVEEGVIESSRYDSYLSIYSNDDNRS
ncbi:ribosome small subunit-dependent GTPase A [Sphingobacterium rhinopitheci]|uniref:ribosome small subunit-dependent GTPase A n=1 Tax=Sphingobacterium rhinopitheci TaxID=2781960 RepID=UPI001F520D5B|nr:ribosome small subunit-dependent GTPase A [Sphingobacterium rhinopitheci]MCI0921491.1 ribosome small subunit-dependent GTPase A [Sphingobacterium rhinopitheci]